MDTKKTATAARSARKNARVDSARFITSAPTLDKCPATNLPEYAFIGRSNVGKSSLINMITGVGNLAKTSSTPGKTMLLNFFNINDTWNIVDLPGYGYAQRSKADRAKLERMIRSYILGRKQMTNLFVLVDSRHEPQKIDLEFMAWLGENGVPFSIVFTKVDKLSSTAAKKVLQIYTDRLLEEWEELPPIFVTSSADRRGRDNILDYIDRLNKLCNEPTTIDERFEENTTNIQNTTAMAQNENKTPDIIEQKVDNSVDYLPGAAVDKADDETVSPQQVDARTKEQNNNPRSHDLF